MPFPAKLLVVAKYREDVAWLSGLPAGWSSLVYSKDETEANHPDFRPLPNLGREAHTYLHFILEHYDALPELATSTQGSPFDHAPDFLERLEKISSGTMYTPLSAQALIFDSLGNPHLRGSPPTSTGFDYQRFYEYLLEHACPPLQYCFANALFAVSRQSILRRPKSFYLKCQDTITCMEAIPGESRVGRNLMEAHFFERLWHAVFPPEPALAPPPEKLPTLTPLIAAWRRARREGDARAAHELLVKINDALK